MRSTASARWGTEKDIKPFVDPKFENNVILTGTEFLTMNTRPKNPANARNLNCLRDRLVRLGQDPVLAHPAAPAGPFLLCGGRSQGRRAGPGGRVSAKARGIRSRCSTASTFQNPCTITRWRISSNEADILKFVNALISNTKGEGKEGDPFWTKVRNAFVLRPCRLYHLRGAGGRTEHEHAGGHDLRHGGQGG